jgi:hypothetical protein
MPMRQIALLLGALEEFPRSLNALVNAAPPAAFDFVPDSWQGAPGEALTLRQHICHLRDIERDGYQPRFTRTLGEDGPFLPSLNGLALVGERNYDATEVGGALEAYSEARRQTMSIIANVSARDLTRPAIFEGYGRVNLLALIHFLCSHDQQHQSAVQWLLGKFASAQ